MSTPTSAIQAIGEAVTSFFNCLTQYRITKPEATIIKENKNLKAATNVAEKIFVITDRYVEQHKYNLERRDYNKYKRLRKQFDKKD